MNFDIGKKGFFGMSKDVVLWMIFFILALAALVLFSLWITG